MQSNDTRSEAQPFAAVRGHLSIVNRARALIGQRPITPDLGYSDADVVADSEHYQRGHNWARELASELRLRPSSSWTLDDLTECTAANPEHISVGAWQGLRWFIVLGPVPGIRSPRALGRESAIALERYLDAAHQVIGLPAGTRRTCIEGLDLDVHCEVERVAGFWWHARALDVLRSREGGSVNLVRLEGLNYPTLVGDRTILQGRSDS